MGADGCTAECCLTFRGQTILMLIKLSQALEKDLFTSLKEVVTAFILIRKEKKKKMGDVRPVSGME